MECSSATLITAAVVVVSHVLGMLTSTHATMMACQIQEPKTALNAASLAVQVAIRTVAAAVVAAVSWISWSA
jgi:hypothetical protein